MSDVRTFKLRYVGRRFEGARLPLEVVSDLPAFRDLLVGFVKATWKRNNADRKRLPRGFDRSISLVLTGIEDGSAVPCMVWDRGLAQENLPGFSDSLDEVVAHSYAEILGLFSRLREDGQTVALSPEQVRALDRFGSSLREDERIEFVGSGGEDGRVVYIDFNSRKHLITSIKDTYNTKIGGVGELITASTSGFIVIDVQKFGHVTLQIDQQTVKEVFDGNLGSLVQFDVLAKFDREDNLKSVIETYDADLVDETIVRQLERCRTRLEELKGLAEGWNDGDGQAVSGPAYQTASRILSARPLIARSLRIFPTFAGGILFELETEHWDLSIECLPNGQVEMYGVTLQGNDDLQPVAFQLPDAKFYDEFDKY